MLSADFLHLAKDVEMVDANADIFHLDIMDGVLVPNLSYGFPVVEAIAGLAVKPLDVHLMIVEPYKYIERFAKTGASMISFHLEAARKAGRDAGEILDQIRSHGVRAGIAINPDIPVEDLFPYLEKADFILVMSVFAGFGGQKYIPETTEKIKALKKLIAGRNVEIEMDGGATEENAAEILNAGTDILVAGSAVFRAADPKAAIAALKAAKTK